MKKEEKVCMIVFNKRIVIFAIFSYVEKIRPNEKITARKYFFVFGI